MLDSVYLHAKSREQIPENLWPVLKEQVEEAIKHWREPDRGIWRSAANHSTSRRARSCAGWPWTAAPNSPRCRAKSYAQQWHAIAEEIKDDIPPTASTTAVLTQRYGDDALDASLLLAVLTRFLPPDDPRIRATVMAIAEELTEDGLVLRYRVQETDDGLSGEEGTFTICSFWLVSALVEIGEIHQARHLCERLLGFAHRCTSTPRRSSRAPAGTWATSAGVHPSGVDQRRRARDPCRGGGRLRVFQPANAPCSTCSSPRERPCLYTDTPRFAYKGGRSRAEFGSPRS